MATSKIKEGIISARDSTSRCLEIIHSKKWAQPTAMALRSTSLILATLTEGIPFVGILGGALQLGSALLDPQPSNSEMNNNIGAIKNEVQSSFKLIAKDMKKIEDDLSETKRIVIASHYLDGIEQVNASFRIFIDGAQNLEQTFQQMEYHIFELQTNAKKSLNPTKVSSYLNSIKATETIESFQQKFSYVTSTMSRYLQLMCAYYIFKNDTNRVGIEFDRFNQEFNILFGVYQEIIAAKMVNVNKEEMIVGGENELGTAVKTGMFVDRVETAYNNFDVPVCFKLELRNYTSFNLIAGEPYLNSGRLLYSSTNVKSGEMELIAGRKSHNSLKGVEGVVTWNIRGTQKALSVLFSLPYSFTISGANCLAVGIHDKIDQVTNEPLTAKNMFKEMSNEQQTNFSRKKFSVDTEAVLKYTDSENRFSAVGVMGKEHRCIVTVFLTASDTNEHSLTAGNMEIDSPGSEENDREPTNLFAEENGKRVRCFSVVTPESHSKSISPTLSSSIGSTLTNNKMTATPGEDHEGSDGFDKELNSVLIELGAVSLYKPLHEAGVSTKELWDLSDQNLIEIGLNTGPQSTYKKARKMSLDVTQNKKGQWNTPQSISTINIDDIKDIECNKSKGEHQDESDCHGKPENSFGSQSATEHVCMKCKKNIAMGSYIEAINSIWCPEHFTCTDDSCQKLLRGIGFKGNNGYPYCPNCYAKLFGPDCGKCKEKIIDKSVIADGIKYHSECFVCNQCGKKFGTSSYKVDNNAPYCLEDWNKLFAKKCASCELPIKHGEKGGLVGSFNAYYHSNCLNCAKCDANLSGGRFKIQEEKPVCISHTS